ncbi:hypothetical protein CYLTODRAFT_446620 [Cylindrobasidium torrendii FP15055 ss-10]|uniref:BTB domain-containing protein n=1 Tax=Cylindrobasidium torrendii FP15055 ss-10 TaxID=1314674 RepID=A0A0D7AYZ6_9AGAR|nr:hypothetical protein CYLTODRAFT_446620 [Cylindrobasidium torrendii FP15055 ss-10]
MATIIRINSNHSGISLTPDGPDDWTSSPSFAIRSAFKYTPPHTSSSSTFTSPRCGLGWTFTLSHHSSQTDAYVSFDAPTGLPQMLKLTLQATLTDTSGMTVQLGPAPAISCVQLSSMQDYCIGQKNQGFMLSGQIRVVFTVELSESPFASPTMPMQPVAAAHSVLVKTLESGELVDVKFCLYSAINKDGYLCCPKALYASREILANMNSYLDTLVQGGFAESELVDLDGEIALEDGVEMYDYEEDSDLEDADIVTLDKKGKGRAAMGSGRMGRISYNKNIAHNTFRGLLVYLYTLTLEFAPLKSSGITSPNPNASSPKSIYRVADMVDLPELKQLAFTDIRSKLTPTNIYTELFSRFTSLYPDILDMQVKYIIENWDACEAQQDDMLRRCMEGEFPYGAQAMSALFKALRRPSTPPPQPSPQAGPPSARLPGGQTLTDRLTRALPTMRPRPHRGPLQRPTVTGRRSAPFGPYSGPTGPRNATSALEARTGPAAAGASTSNSTRPRFNAPTGDISWSTIAPGFVGGTRMLVDEDSDVDEDPMWSRFDIGGWN